MNLRENVKCWLRINTKRRTYDEDVKIDGKKRKTVKELKYLGNIIKYEENTIK